MLHAPPRPATMAADAGRHSGTPRRGVSPHPGLGSRSCRAVMRYLLDTNIVSDLVRNPQGRSAEHIRRIGEAHVCTSIIVAAELRYGAAKRRSPRLARQLEAVLGALHVLPFAAPADAVYGEIRTRREHPRKPVGANHLLVPAQPSPRGYGIVTCHEG